MIPSGNPFAFPGMPGAAPSFDAGGANPVMQSLDMMKQVWGNMGSMASASPSATLPGIDDLDKRITDLRAIESWLNLNLTMLRGSIQGLEVQRATISTLRTFAQNVSNVYQTQSPLGKSNDDSGELPPPSPLEIVLGLRKAPGAPAAPHAQPFGFPYGPAPTGPAPTAAAAAPAAAPPPAQPVPPPSFFSTSDVNPAAQAAANAAATAGAPSPVDAPAIDGSAQATAWWAMLQDQFAKITSAAAQAVPPVPQMPTIPQMPHMDLGKAAAAVARSVFEPSRAPDAPARKTAAPRKAAATKTPARKASASKTAAAKTSAKTAAKPAAKRAPAAEKAAPRKARGRT